IQRRTDILLENIEVQRERLRALQAFYKAGLVKDMDVSAGSKAFSRETARFLVENSSPGRALGTDGEWPVLLQRAGFRVDYVTVDGLDWESADRYQEQAASPERQRQGAAEYDADPQHWAARVGVALEIVQTALETSRRELSKNWL
ncbi:MAG TPA: hypothetical protein VF498_14050, partial [Anaerolineales bacterium]